MKADCVKCLLKEEHPFHDDGSTNLPDIDNWLTRNAGPKHTAEIEEKDDEDD